MTELCVIHANCQGEVLRKILLETPSFANKFHIHLYTNYIKEPIAARDLSECALFLYQKLDSSWGELASEYLISKLSPKCQVIQIPNMFFKGYWPFWTHKIAKIDFANTLLEKLLDLGLSTQAILQLYLQGRHPDFFKVKEIALESLQYEVAKETKLIPYTHILQEFWHQEPLFYTVNHPGKRLSLQVANSLLKILGLAPLSQAYCRDFIHPDANFNLPIHPVVGKHLGLSFTGEEVRYNIFAQKLTHREYVVAYLACRLNNYKNIAAFLFNSATNED